MTQCLHVCNPKMSKLVKFPYLQYAGEQDWVWSLYLIETLSSKSLWSSQSSMRQMGDENMKKQMKRNKNIYRWRRNHYIEK